MHVLIVLDALAPLSPLFKENAGAGAGLPGFPPGPFPAGHPFAVNIQIPVPPFPAILGALYNLTHVQLSTLSAIYNNGFGIVAGDNIAIRRSKFENWCAGH
jgi:hypothetical protein